jgi:hypothetical protein
MADTDEPRLTRRTLLATTVLGAGSALGLGACAAPTSRGSSAASTPAPPAAHGCRLFAQPDLDFAASFGLGEAAYGCSEVGEVLATVERINAAGASYETFVDGFSALARRLTARATAAMGRTSTSGPTAGPPRSSAATTRSSSKARARARCCSSARSPSDPTGKRS